MHPRFPDDAGRVVVFRAPDEADDIAGQVLCVDGGQTAFLGRVPSLRYG